MATSSLPSYSSSPPIYSPEPAVNETRLDYSPHTQDIDPSGGVYVQCYEKITLIIYQQDKNPDVPRISSRRPLHASLHLENSDLVTSISVKLVGRIEIFALSQLTHIFFDQEICNETQILYSSEGTQPLNQTAFPFSFILPRYFEYLGSRHPLPPSYDLTLADEPSGQYIKCSYFLTISVSRIRLARLPMLGSWTASFIVNLKYCPRSRPLRPIQAGIPFFEAIKICPEEIRQFLFTIPVDSEGEVHAQLYLPSIGVFGLQDRIPFNLQVTGNDWCLRQLVQPGKPAPNVRIYLLRQIIMNVDKVNIARQLILGHANLRSLPPVLADECNLNWEGYLVSTEPTSVASFTAGPLALEDFIILEFKTLNFRKGIPIKLVTDSWSESVALDVLGAA